MTVHDVRAIDRVLHSSESARAIVRRDGQVILRNTQRQLVRCAALSLVSLGVAGFAFLPGLGWYVRAAALATALAAVLRVVNEWRSAVVVTAEGIVVRGLVARRETPWELVHRFDVRRDRLSGGRVEMVIEDATSAAGMFRRQMLPAVSGGALIARWDLPLELAAALSEERACARALHLIGNEW